jgi:hypothetical protein
MDSDEVIAGFDASSKKNIARRVPFTSIPI